MDTTVLVIGGTGAMGRPIVRSLMSGPDRKVRILTRDPAGRHAAALKQAGGGRVETVQGNLDDEASLATAMSGVGAVFCNTDFFSTANPRREYEQGLRALRTAQAAGVGHFIWSSLDDAGALTNGRLPVPHYDAKAAVASWIGLMRSEEFMQQDAGGWFSKNVTILVTGPYFENLQAGLVQAASLTDGRQDQRFNIAIGSGRWPMIALDDIAWFARHILDHPDEWRGRTLRRRAGQPPGADQTPGLRASKARPAQRMPGPCSVTTICTEVADEPNLKPLWRGYLCRWSLGVLWP